MNSGIKEASFQPKACSESGACLEDPKFDLPHSVPDRSCGVCGEQNKQLLFEQRFSNLSEGSLHKGYDVVACRQCGFCFADRIPSQEAFDDYYEKMSKYERHYSAGQTSSYDLGRFQTSVTFLQSLPVSTQARILEIGCSTGGLLALLNTVGYSSVLGVDPSPSCAKTAGRLYGIRVVPAKLSDIDLPGKSFDLIILAGVLEHVRDLDQALIRLSKLLTPQGQLYFVVPDASRYGEGEDAPFQEFSSEHINFFGPMSLSNLLVRHGFSLTACQQSMIQGNYRTSTPVIHAVYQKLDAATSPGTWAHDTETVIGLKNYIAQSHREDQRLHAVVDRIVSEGQPLIVWGTGSLTLRLLEASRLKDARITAFVDSNPCYQGKTLRGSPIIGPNSLSRLTDPILISSRVYQKEIHDQITKDLKLTNRVEMLYELDGAKERNV
jgi:SAM-dependent methyltransferase